MLAALSDFSILLSSILTAVITFVVGPYVQARVTGRQNDESDDAEIEAERAARVGDIAEMKATAAFDARRVDKMTEAIVWLNEQFKSHKHG